MQNEEIIRFGKLGLGFSLQGGSGMCLALKALLNLGSDNWPIIYKNLQLYTNIFYRKLSELFFKQLILTFDGD